MNPAQVKESINKLINHQGYWIVGTDKSSKYKLGYHGPLSEHPDIIVCLIAPATVEDAKKDFAFLGIEYFSSGYTNFYKATTD